MLLLLLPLLTKAAAAAAQQLPHLCATIAPGDCSGAFDASWCGQVIAAAVASCSEQGGGTVRLAAGVFRLGAADRARAWHVTADGGTGNPGIGTFYTGSHYVNIAGAANVQLTGSVVDGAAATFFVLSGIVNFIRITDTVQFSLTNIVIDMERPNYSYGQLDSCDEQGPSSTTRILGYFSGGLTDLNEMCYLNAAC